MAARLPPGLAHALAGARSPRLAGLGWRGCRRCSGARGSTRTPGRVSWAQRGPTGQVKEGRDPPVRCGDGEAEWRLGAVTRGVSSREEGVGGDVGEL
jgi:hypothetical protein